MTKESSGNGKQRLKRRKIKEGEIVAIPAADGHGYLVGVVARAENSYSLGAAILLYIFGPRWGGVPKLENLDKLVPSNALSVVHTGGRRIVEGRWPVIGALDAFTKADWPIPIFGRISLSVPGKAWLIHFLGDRIGKGAPREEWEVTVEEARKHREEAVWGVDVAAYEATKKIQEME